MPSTLDLIVIGLGPAGISCALQAHRDGLNLLAVGDEAAGGLVPAARRLDNLAAEPGISGIQFAARMASQLEETDVPITEGLVTGIRKVADQGVFHVGLADGRSFQARCVCLATGTRPRIWGLQTEARWLHRDARSLPKKLDGARVTVIGGGEAALDTALTARDRGAAATVLVRGASLRAVRRLIDEAHRTGVVVETGAAVRGAEHKAEGWALTTEDDRRFEADELVVSIGREPRDELALELCARDASRTVVQPSCPGLFLAGDLIRERDRYVATALGDGQRAAIEAGRHLEATP